MKRLKTLLGSALLLSACLVHAESGTALKADKLRAEPFADAKTSGSISRNEKLDITEKKGAWLKVKAPRGSGWVRLLSVRRDASGKANETAGVLSVASGRTGTGQVVSTTGVRGLNEEDLKSAKFNEEETRMLEATTVSTDQARQFAASAGLKARKLNYLPKPARQGGQ